MTTTSGTAASYVAITKSDTDTIGSNGCIALFVGTAGDVTIKQNAKQSPVTFKNVANGTFLPVSAYQLMFTGTTASDIVALF